MPGPMRGMRVPDLRRVFSDVVRFEIELWDAVEPG